jgi:LmbE family N-acetylglucosaminyl deacetylase
MTVPEQRVLVCMAHPDDPEFFCGGTLALWAAEGRDICYVLATSGDKGSQDATLPSAELTALREAEQRAAADVIGAGEIVFLRRPDGELVADLGLRRDLVRVIRLFRPDIVVSTDPLYYYGDQRVNHPDHRAMGDATLSALFPAAGNSRFFPELWTVEGLAPHSPSQVWIAVPMEPNVEVDISSSIGRKLEAIARHKSQLPEPEFVLERVRQRAAQPDGRYLERFRRIILR